MVCFFLCIEFYNLCCLIGSQSSVLGLLVGLFTNSRAWEHGEINGSNPKIFYLINVIFVVLSIEEI